MNEDEFPEVGAAFDEEAWDYLYLNYAKIADAITVQVDRQKEPDRIRLYIVRKYGVNREDIAKRVEAAARHLLGVRKK